MTTRNLRHPSFEIEGDGDELLIRFRVPGSNFGPVEIELDLEAAERLIESLDQAVIFAGGDA